MTLRLPLVSVNGRLKELPAGDALAVGGAYLSAGVYVMPSVTDNGDGTVTLGDGEYVFYSSADGTAPLVHFTIPSDTYAFTDNVANYILADYNSGSPTISVATSTSTINNTTIIPVVTVFRTGTHLDLLEWDEPGKALANKLMRRLVRTERFAAEPNGLTLGEVATRTVTVTAGNVWNGPHQAVLTSFSSATDELSLYVHVAGVWTKSTITQYNNTQYDDGADAQTLTNNRYAVNWVFRAVNTNEQECYIVLGTGDYSLPDAISSTAPANLPAEITSTAILIGRIIVQKSAASATQIDSAFSVVFSSASANNHAALSNLAWASSAHTGTAGALPLFDGAGAATEIQLSNVIALASAYG